MLNEQVRSKVILVCEEQDDREIEMYTKVFQAYSEKICWFNHYSSGNWKPDGRKLAPHA